MKKPRSVLNIVFFCFVLNLLPIASMGLFRISSGIYTLMYAGVYILQTLSMFWVCRGKIKKITKKEALIIVICIFNAILAILFSFFKYQAIDNNEYLFCMSLISNVALFVILAPKFKASEKETTAFIYKVLIIGIISIIVNVALNYKLIINLSAITNSYNVNFSSFFPNRNQFGLFMFVMIFLNSLLMTQNNNKKYKILQAIFICNLFLSMSRNSILGLSIFYLTRYLQRKKSNKKKISISAKRIIEVIFVVLCLGSACSLILTNKAVGNKISDLFVRVDNLESGSGRFEAWHNGIAIATENVLLFGAGRYLSIKLNHITHNNDLEYFHSIYVEKLATHGIIGLFWLIGLMWIIWNKVKSSNLENNIKSIILASLVSFWVFSLFETTTRFSIGYADSFFMIFFFTLPQIIANSDFRGMSGEKTIKAKTPK